MSPTPATTPCRALQAFQALREVRHTVIRVISAHLQPDNRRATTVQSWRSLDFDFTGAVFDGGSFVLAEFSGGRINFYGAVFSGGEDSFDGAESSGGTVSFEKVADWQIPRSFRLGPPRHLRSQCPAAANDASLCQEARVNRVSVGGTQYISWGDNRDVIKTTLGVENQPDVFHARRCYPQRAARHSAAVLLRFPDPCTGHN